MVVVPKVHILKVPYGAGPLIMGGPPNVPLVLYPWLKGSYATIVVRGQDRWINIAENHSLIVRVVVPKVHILKVPYGAGPLIMGGPLMSP